MHRCLVSESFDCVGSHVIRAYERREQPAAANRRSGATLVESDVLGRSQMSGAAYAMRHSVLCILFASTAITLAGAYAAPVELPPARIISAPSSSSFSISLRATNRVRATVPVGTADGAANHTLRVDGLYLYGVNGTAPSLFPPVIVVQQG